MAPDAQQPSGPPIADPPFLRVFMPYEMRLAQRRVLVWGPDDAGRMPTPFLGLYLVRLEAGKVGDDVDARGAELVLTTLLDEVLRDSDVPVRLGEGRFLALVRDLEPPQAYVVAQRFLSSAARIPGALTAGLRVRVGFVVYPLSTKPDLPPERWPALVELAESLSRRDAGGAASSGYGVAPGDAGASPDIPETDLFPLLERDLDALARSGVVQLQRVRIVGRP